MARITTTGTMSQVAKTTDFVGRLGVFQTNAGELLKLGRLERVTEIPPKMGTRYKPSQRAMKAFGFENGTVLYCRQEGTYRLLKKNGDGELQTVACGFGLEIGGVHVGLIIEGRLSTQMISATGTSPATTAPAGMSMSAR